MLLVDVLDAMDAVREGVGSTEVRGRFNLTEPIIVTGSLYIRRVRYKP